MSGNSRSSRLTPLRAAMFSLHPAAVCLTGLLLAQPVAQAAEPTWDCRMAADGRSWQCSRDGQPVIDPPAPVDAGGAVITAPPEPAPRVMEPLPATADKTPSPAAALPERQGASAPVPAATGTPPQAPAAPEEAAGPPPEAGPKPAPRAIPAAPLAGTSPAPKPSIRQPAPRPVAPAEPAASALSPAAQQAFDTDGAMPDLTAPAARSKPAPAADPMLAPAVEPATAAEVVPAVDTAVDRPKAQAVAEEPADLSMRSDLDAGIDWQGCRMPRGDIGPAVATADAQPLDLPVEVSADTAVAELGPERALFQGNVELVQGPLQISAGELSLDRKSGEVVATGGFSLHRPDVRMAGSSATYQLGTGEGSVEQARYRIPASRARGEAEHAAFLGKGLSEYRNITYTTCRPGSSDWLLEAEELTLDQAEGLGTARNAKLRFLGMPVMYVPTFTFPIDDRRRSGILVPSMGYSDNTGFDVSVPYYLNLAPDYDLTLTPRLMSRRGAMLGGEFRFLTESTAGTLAAEFLPNDSAHEGDSDSRGSVSFNSRTRFNARSDAEIRLNYVSDSDYLGDLGGSLAATSATHVERAGEVNYHADNWDLLGRVQYYQTIDDAIAFSDRPYSRLPQLKIDLEQPQGVAGTTYHLGAEYVNFHRRNSVRGHRLDLFPAISLPIRNSWSFIEPKVGARFTGYRLKDQAAALSDDPSHLTGLFSLDSGLHFDRGTAWFGKAATQTLEPRLFYLYVPEHAQDDQPVFDTAVLDFSFDNLFRENRFNGPDRFGDANQLTLALTSRLLSDVTGAELLRASIGQILYFDDRGVSLPGEHAATDNSSALAGELAAELGGGWRGRTGLQWNPHDGDNGTIEQALAQISYLGEDGQVFNAAYRLRDGVTQQTDLAMLWPVNEQLRLIARHNHSLKDDRLLEALAGVEYGRCCWRVRALVRNYTDDQGDDHNLAFLLQLELNGLGRLGDDIDSTLERGIYGYRTDDDN